MRPVVRFSLSKDFNDVAVADLKSGNGILILHIIDHTTRFSAATVVKLTKTEVTDHAATKTFFLRTPTYSVKFSDVHLVIYL